MRRFRGFTLLELLMTLAVATVLITTALSSFNHWVAKKRLHNTGLALTEALSLVRSEAIHSGYDVALLLAESGEMSAEWVIEGSPNCSGALRCLRWRAAQKIAVVREDLPDAALFYDRDGRSRENSTAPVCFSLIDSQRPELALSVLLRSTGVPQLLAVAEGERPCE